MKQKKEKLLEEYKNYRQNIFDCVYFCATKAITSSQSHRFAASNQNAHRIWRNSLFELIKPSIDAFKATSVALYGEEYSVLGIYDAAISKAYKDYRKMCNSI